MGIGHCKLTGGQAVSRFPPHLVAAVGSSSLLSGGSTAIQSPFEELCWNFSVVKFCCVCLVVCLIFSVIFYFFCRAPVETAPGQPH